MRIEPASSILYKEFLRDINEKDLFRTDQSAVIHIPPHLLQRFDHSGFIVIFLFRRLLIEPRKGQRILIRCRLCINDRGRGGRIALLCTGAQRGIDLVKVFFPVPDADQLQNQSRFSDLGFPAVS